MGKQFKNVDATYGAPMGRAGYGIPENCEPHTVALFRVRFVDGDYDDGGAYWGGGGGGSPLYCARDDGNGYRQFARARSRDEAAQLLGLSARVLKRPTNTQRSQSELIEGRKRALETEEY